MSPPKLVWEPGLAEELAVNGSTLRIVGLGKPNKADDEVIGWYVILSHANGEHKILMMQVKVRPKLYKTYAGLRSMIRECAPTWTTVTLPIVPDIRSEDELWGLIDKLNGAGKLN